jgi:hypothetical protein
MRPVLITKVTIMLQYNTMKSNKRELKQMERQLVVALTEACETAKAEVPGFCWLTHDNGVDHFPAGLRVTWIFDTQANLEQALANGFEQRARVWTSDALEQIGLDPGSISNCLQFDSEEACMNFRNGNWLARLTQIRRTRH